MLAPCRRLIFTQEFLFSFYRGLKQSIYWKQLKTELVCPSAF
ncbi:hypothetical protein HMPREF3226_01883 [Prevotella corporis]|uniref:Uncharacterized protein n=1 Tax=Prevotella corporis TaxID=28128 RepID=A0A133PZY0_9BACT|nr:hypothetical protein HMPREF3226_01883 [Prevotella corporis]DAW27370.1 MAG TPA: hypothetical protein [Caudoviricetes sp.]